MNEYHIGQVERARDVGSHQGSRKVIWCACEGCGLERWVLLRAGKPESIRCYKCSRNYPGRIKKINRGKDHWHWKGGRSATHGGYVELWMDPQDELFSMASKEGYAYEHRIVMARHLGRALSSDEEVHHINCDKHDNRIDNLEVLSRSEHASKHLSNTMELLRRISELEEQLRQGKP